MPKVSPACRASSVTQLGLSSVLVRCDTTQKFHIASLKIYIAYRKKISHDFFHSSRQYRSFYCRIFRLFFGGKFGGNFLAETAIQPIKDLSNLFEKLRKDKKFLKLKDHYFKNYLGGETPLFKLETLSEYLGGAQIWCKDVSAIHGQAHKGYHATVNA